jgi:hypothetical protein
MAHEARDDFLMLLGSIYLLIAGAGQWSIDAALARHAGHPGGIPVGPRRPRPF